MNFEDLREKWAQRDKVLGLERAVADLERRLKVVENQAKDTAESFGCFAVFIVLLIGASITLGTVFFGHHVKPRTEVEAKP